MKQKRFNASLLLSTLLLFCISFGSITTTFAKVNNNTSVVAKKSTIYVPNERLAAYMPTKGKVAKGTKVNLLSSVISNGRCFDEISDGKFIVATNLKGKSRKLKKDAYVIFPDGGKLKKLKKNTKVMTYGLQITGYLNKKYYIVKGGKFVKKLAFIN
ncbi:hypothetical protein F5ESL0233_05340 [Lactobacillus sp. ESL0233]|uniref:SLAP domain-containing protein n=1 Tax=Lactobacillus sp. ESL0233 TaxID=2069354 RepID=UPI000EFBC22F|nr:SLAP domain-containing protein [Lactobacillus sp. ESL0233]RMC41740.1 hypothetical protein F5ESL0233_05340 [Lactobacillus sp. ESL0233]